MTRRDEPPQASVAVVMLTPDCDMACPYCGAESNFTALTEEQAWRLMPLLAAQGFGSVVLGGGEPFCWKGDLRGLAAEAQRVGLRTQVGTNLQRLPAEAPRWKEVDRWVLPLESAEASAHDALRPGQGSHHALVLRSLDAFQAAGATVTVSSVAHDGSAPSLDGVAKLLQSRVAAGLKLHAWHLYRFQAMGRGGRRNAGRFFLDDAQWRSISRGLKADHPELPILLRPDLLHSKQVAFFWGTLQGLWRQGPLQWSGSVLGPDPEHALAL
jgi:MoaA/NifB/PqqE/SkfB family radical SAM enzyme